MAHTAPAHSEECSGGAVSTGAESVPNVAACNGSYAAAGAACNYGGNRAKDSELLHWTNAYLGTTYGKVEDLSSGTAYCLFTDLLFPGAVNMSKVNLEARRGRESLQNFEALRDAFERVGVDREVPVERLAEGSYRDNLELVQWFKDLFDAQYPAHVAVPPDAGYAMPYIYSPSALYGYHAALHDCRYAEDNYEETDQTGTGGFVYASSRCPGHAPRVGTVPGGGAGAGDFSDTVKELASQVAELKDAVYWLELERNFYYSKLCEIEMLCWEHVGDHGKENVAEQVLDLMRGSDDDEGYEQDEDTSQSGEPDGEAPQQEPQ